MVEPPDTTFRSGDALFAFDADLAIVFWNRAAEELTGVSADKAVGRFCWEVLGGHDERGNLVCHAGCSKASAGSIAAWRSASASSSARTSISVAASGSGPAGARVDR